MPKKQKPIPKQPPWIITSYSDIQNAGEKDEFDAGYMEFIHRETGNSFMREMSWLKGEGAYEIPDFKPAKLTDIWNLFLKYTPGTTGFIYKGWHVKRDAGCFVYILVGISEGKPVERKKNIIGDWVIQQQDFASFIKMLDNIQSELDEIEESSNAPIINLDEARKKKQA